MTPTPSRKFKCLQGTHLQREEGPGQPQIEVPSPTQTRKTERKQPAPKKIEAKKSPAKSKAQKRRKKSIEETPSPSVDLTLDLSNVVPFETTKPQFLTDEYAARWESILVPIAVHIGETEFYEDSHPTERLSPVVIKEFYANLMPTINQQNSPLFGHIWLFHNYYNFSQDKINMYLGIYADDIEDPEIEQDLMAKTITGSLVSYWPTETNLLHFKLLTTKHAILHKITMRNWIHGEHRGELNIQMVGLIYRIGKGIPVGMGHLIYHQVIEVLDQKEPKVKLPFPCTIYDLLSAQGFKPYHGETLEKPTIRLIDSRLKQNSHVLDIYPEQGGSQTSPATIQSSATTIMTAQLLKKNISDLNMVIEVLIEKINLDMQLLEQFKFNKREEELATTTQAAQTAATKGNETAAAETARTS
ncbi:uncharacterized protein LOC116003907 [Ipomoea triloba]|uniref:uncharacterized protein LOC116003907 n=1 Tax=Ipomoea triloba TaxID=35885 RepID=UPI00125E23F9|nr:uncharacterized protein LOC116003907 [Ipomoea triloba]